MPPSIKEGALALGCTQWQAIWRQVLPASIPGIATGVILSISRAIGETAPLILVGAATFVAFNPTGLDSAYTAMPLQIFSWISQPQGRVPRAGGGGDRRADGDARDPQRGRDLAAQPLREALVTQCPRTRQAATLW